MAQITQEITLNIAKQTEYSLFKIPQGDAIDRVFYIKLINGTDDYIVPETAITVFKMNRLNGGVIYNGCPRTSDGKLILTITENISSVDGRFPCTFTMTDSATGGTLSTFMTSIIIEEDANVDKIVTQQGEYTALTDALLQVGDIVSHVEACKVATENAITATANANAATSVLTSLETNVSSAEATRVSSENTRVSSENTRIANESARVTAENTRISNESTRVSSETTRVSNEITRQTFYDAYKVFADWDFATAWKIGNHVYYNRSTYQALTDNTNHIPPENGDTTWKLVAKHGDDGTGGNMMTSVYDTQGKATDIFQYVGDKTQLQTTSKTDVVGAVNELDTEKLDKSGDSKDNSVTFTEASTDTDIISGEKHSVLFGKISKSIKTLRNDVNKSTYNGIEKLKTKMKNGNPVVGVCYGDSTTCGWLTTNNNGLTINESNGYNPYLTHSLGDNWGTIAVNAYPAKLQTLLRDFYKNTNITIHNAGFGAIQMQDGWANNNFEAAVLSYTNVDFVILSFGLNDSRTNSYNVENYYNEYKKVIEKCIANNIIPIIMSTDSTSMIDGSRASDANIDSEKSRIYDQISKLVSNEYNSLYIDMNNYLVDWLNNNDDGFKFRDVQTDYVHVNNIGHNYKAGVILSYLGYNIISTSSSNDISIVPEDVSLHANASNPNTPSYNWDNNFATHKTSRNFLSLNTSNNTVLLEAWIFVSGNQPTLGFNTISKTTAQPKVKIYSNADSTAYYDDDYGIIHTSDYYIYDFKCTKLKYGLNKIVVVSDEDAVDFFFNYIWLRTWKSPTNLDVLYFDTTYWANMGNTHTQFPNCKSVSIPTTVNRTAKYNISALQEDGDNFAQLKKVGSKVQIDTLVKLNYGGIILFPEHDIYATSGYKYMCITAIPNATAGVDYKLNYPFLGTILKTGTDATGIVGDVTKLCIDLERKASNTITVTVYISNRANSLFSFDMTNCNNFSGTVNGVIAFNEPNSHAFAEILSMTVTSIE